MRVGILAIQGDVREHERMFHRLGIATKLVRHKEHLQDLSGLVIPGGESTTIGMLMQEYGMTEEVLKYARTGQFPVWGTCAGLILMATEVVGPSPTRLALMDITADRNAWGRQVSSFEAEVTIATLGPPDFPAVFIRAPRIRRIGDTVVSLAKCQDDVVMAESGPFLVTSFHPELTEDVRVHRYFIEKIEEAGANR